MWFAPSVLLDYRPLLLLLLYVCYSLVTLIFGAYITYLCCECRKTLTQTQTQINPKRHCIGEGEEDDRDAAEGGGEELQGGSL